MSWLQRLGVWAPVILVVLLFGFWLAGPYSDALSDQRAELSHIQRVAAKNRFILREAASLQTQPRPTSLESKGLFYTEASHAGAVAKLSTLVNQAARDAGCQLQSLEPAPEDPDAPGALQVTVRLAAGTESLQRFIYALEVAEPLLLIRGLTMQVSYQYQAAGNIGPEHNALEVQFDVVAVRQIGARP